jgi:hypothetical protein
MTADLRTFSLDEIVEALDGLGRANRTASSEQRADLAPAIEIMTAAVRGGAEAAKRSKKEEQLEILLRIERKYAGCDRGIVMGHAMQALDRSESTVYRLRDELRERGQIPADSHDPGGKREMPSLESTA